MYVTLFYGVIYFNHDTVKEVLERYYTGTEDVFRYYDEVQINMEALPSLLYPFFFSDFSRMSFLIQFMLNKWDCRDATFEDYLDLLTHDSEVKRLFIEHFLPDKNLADNYLKTNNLSPLISVIVELKYEYPLIYALLKVVSNFESTLSLLLETLKSIYIGVEKLHKRLYTHGHSLLYVYSEESIEWLIRRSVKIDESISLTNQQASISYFNTAVIFYQSYGEGKYAFILGHVPNMNIETVIDLLAHPVRRDILKLLSEREYSVTQLSEVLYVTRQSINNHLLLLYDSQFVVLKRKHGPEKYYTLNNPVLEIARMTVNNYLKDLQSSKGHGSLSLLGS